MMPGKSYGSLLKWFARAGAQLAAAVGVAVIAGWLFDIGPLKSILPSLAVMKMNTASGLVAAGASLWILQTKEPASRWRWLARALAGFVAALGGLTLAENVFGFDLGIDLLIVSGVVAAHTPTAGRMSPTTAFDLMLIGLALLFLKQRRPRLAAFAHWLIVPPLFVSMLAVLGYAYGADSLYRIGLYASVALHTALTVFVLSLAVLAADSRHGFALIAASDTAGGVLSRWLLPVIPFLLFMLGLGLLKGQEAGFYELHFGLALMVMISITVCVIALARTGTILHNTDVNRKVAETEIINLNAGLEQRVLERTRELAKLSNELATANWALEELSQHDALTGLPNRRHFDTYLTEQIAVARRHKRSLTLIMYDIDSFKSFNDNYGHQAGDECLKQVAAVLKSSCRRPSDLVARYGGEEFAAILPDTEQSSAEQIAEAARAAIVQMQIPHAHSAPAPFVSISGGVASLLCTADTTAYQLIAAADQCLYEAKRAGRNRIVCAQSEPGSWPMLKIAHAAYQPSAKVLIDALPNHCNHALLDFRYVHSSDV